ncbi:MAG: ROK family protein [Geminicoccaceae bacterium]|nr:ROK family protein [Geminicoccaceae bacterium]
MSPILALDIGGTKILASLVDGATVVERRVMATRRETGPEEWIGQIVRAVEGWEGRYDGIGCAVTGVVAGGCWSPLNTGTLAIPPHYPLADRLGAAFGCRPVLANDAQAAAWGEYLHGAGQGRDMVFLTVSTGIGGGVVTHGRLLVGRGGVAGSFGQAIDGVGARLEDRASGLGIEAAARRAGHDLRAPAIFAACAAGESWAEAVVRASAVDVALLCCNLQLAFDPQVIVIGGGVGMAGGYLERLRRQCDARPDRLRPSLVAAALGADAGVIGIAALARAECTAAPGEKGR